MSFESKKQRFNVVACTLVQRRKAATQEGVRNEDSNVNSENVIHHDDSRASAGSTSAPSGAGGAHCRVGDAVADRSNSGTDS